MKSNKNTPKQLIGTRGRGQTKKLIIQIDEYMLRGRGRFNRGKMLLGVNNLTNKERNTVKKLNAEPGPNMLFTINYS
ncbi:hypothetical protein HZS_3661 [Henneguya salminicola]|nr:hypothetical protein HZS_3661 [Henneguya salminicola]